MAKIHLLDNDTINKIAAGEVIENPRSIVKELVENSIDAGADEIIVEIKNGGKKLIRITDNGKGIDRDEIEEAFKRHCTSKIESSEDLESLYTLGFRGEALASIAAVSHVEIISRTKDREYGVRLIIQGGTVVSKEDAGCPIGTTISVTELFYNVPARKKFLKSDASESGNINEIVVSLALSRQNISFKYINNGSIAFKTPKTDKLINVISSLYDRDLYDSLVEVSYTGTMVTVSGYTTNLNYYRGNRKNQLVFVNNRFIKHKRINYYIEAAYNTLLPKGKYPACFLKIDISPSDVDVNVHPAKTEVRFQNEEAVLGDVKNAIYKSLRSVNIIKEVKSETIIQHKTSKIDPPEHKGLGSIFDEKYIKDEKSAYDAYRNLNSIKYTEISLDDDSVKTEEKNIFDEAIKEAAKESRGIYELEKNILHKSTEKAFYVYENKEANAVQIPEAAEILNREEAIGPAGSENEPEDEEFMPLQTAMELDEDKSSSSVPRLSVIGILMNTYILCEDEEGSAMYMLDQHAAHERINYEKFLNQYNNGKILKQELMIPEVINLSYDDYHAVMSNKEIFDKMGLSVENFGNNAIIINNIPVIFCNANIRDIFFTILDSVKDSKKVSIGTEIDKIIKNACVKSVKSGDKLHLPEIKRLIDDLRNTQSPYTCPHGRPVIIKITKYEIERMFERIQI